ncbi:hypothetical protein ACSBR2_005452 [Camellia fascicularis]
MFLKGKFKGTLLATTAKDGNQGLFLVVFAIVDSENSRNWEWFLRQLAQIVNDSRTLTFVSDRNVGLLQAMPIVFPLAHHAFCLLHLQMNLRDRMKYVNAEHNIGLIRKLRKCTYAPTVTSFNHKIEILKQCSPTVVDNFLKDLHPQYWANAYFKYGEMWSNAAESFNNWVHEARHLPITQLVDAIRGKSMEQMSKRRSKSSRWVSEICLKMEKSYRRLKVVMHRLLAKLMLMSLRFPCSHVVVAFRNSGRNIYNFVKPFYHVAKYRATYSGSIHLIPTVSKPKFITSNYLIAPPIYKRPPGQPKRKRILSKGEVVQQIRCGRCGKISHHNRKTCKEPM